MKILSLSLLMATILFCGNTIFAQVDKLVQGAEVPVFHQLNETSVCYIFKEFIVKTVTPDAEAGEDIMVFKNSSPAKTKSVCQTKGAPYLAIKNPDANFFIGLSGKFLFIDSGTAPDSRGLEIYNLTSRKSVFTTEYSEWEKRLKLTADKILFYEANSAKDGLLKNCPSAGKWKKQGLSVGWMQPKKLDLETMKATNIGGLRCMAIQ